MSSAESFSPSINPSLFRNRLQSRHEAALAEREIELEAIRVEIAKTTRYAAIVHHRHVEPSWSAFQVAGTGADYSFQCCKLAMSMTLAER